MLQFNWTLRTALIYTSSAAQNSNMQVALIFEDFAAGCGVNALSGADFAAICEPNKMRHRIRRGCVFFALKVKTAASFACYVINAAPKHEPMAVSARLKGDHNRNPADGKNHIDNLERSETGSDAGANNQPPRTECLAR